MPEVAGRSDSQRGLGGSLRRSGIAHAEWALIAAAAAVASSVSTGGLLDLAIIAAPGAGTAMGKKFMLRSVWCVSRSVHSFEAMKQKLNGMGFDLPMHHWPAEHGFSEHLQASVPRLVNAGLVEPAAVPRVLMKDEWHETWKRERRWRHVRREREAPGRKLGGWLSGLDLTRASFANAMSHLRLWQTLGRRDQSRESPGLRRADLILDDGCRLLPGLTRAHLEERLEAVPAGWEIVLLGGDDALGHQRDQEAVAPGVQHLYPWFQRTTSAYVLTTPGARGAFKACTPLRWRLDRHLAGCHSARRRDLGESERLFAPTGRPVGYCLVPPLAEGRRDGGRSARARRSGAGDAAGAAAAEAASADSDGEKQMFEELDTVVAWSMRLTDRPMFVSWGREIEGHTNRVPESMKLINKLAEEPTVKTICEIGFNAGHSTLRWLLHSQAKVYSFDLGTHEYARPAAMWLANKFPGRLHVTWGDSLRTLPEFHAKNPEVKCDVIFIDGGHDIHVARQDLKNFIPMANPDRHRILMDDSNLDDVKTAWQERIKAGHVVETESFVAFVDGVETGQSVGYYTPSAFEEPVA